MKYNPGQKVVINKNQLSIQQDSVVSILEPPYVVTVSYILPDPHSGFEMYCFKDCPWGWYENEVECLYIEDDPIESRFEILDL